MSKNKALRKFGEHWRSLRCSRLLLKQLYFVGLKLFTEFSYKKRCPKARKVQPLQHKNPVIVLMKEENHFFANEKTEDVSLWVEESTFDVGELGREIGCLS